MPVDQISAEALDILLNELDIMARHHALSSAGQERDENRIHSRKPFRVGCTVRFLSPGKSRVLEMTGRTRNLSRNGVGLVTRRVFAIGEPIELEIALPGRPTTCMAGLVRFCRYVSHGWHEIGVELKTAGTNSVFRDGTIHALQILEWQEERM